MLHLYAKPFLSYLFPNCVSILYVHNLHVIFYFQQVLDSWEFSIFTFFKFLWRKPGSVKLLHHVSCGTNMIWKFMFLWSFGRPGSEEYIRSIVILFELPLWCLFYSWNDVIARKKEELTYHHMFYLLNFQSQLSALLNTQCFNMNFQPRLTNGIRFSKLGSEIITCSIGKSSSAGYGGYGAAFASKNDPLNSSSSRTINSWFLYSTEHLQKTEFLCRKQQNNKKVFTKYSVLPEQKQKEY